MKWYITTKLLSWYVYIQQESRRHEVVDGFEDRWGFPQVAGAIDGIQIPIVCPKDSLSDYYNREGFNSVIMQTLVDFQ